MSDIRFICGDVIDVKQLDEAGVYSGGNLWNRPGDGRIIGWARV
ncbi:MAG: hypothetical protein AAF591_15625 [Verrucomicrobiota bacterium]